MTNIEVHFEGKIALKVIVEKEGRVLLIRDPRISDDIWELPGGRMNIDEDPREAMRREFREEMGVDISIGEVVHMEQFLQGNEGKRAFVIVFAATLDNDVFVTDAHEVSKVEWFTPTDVSHLKLFPEYKAALNSYFAQK